MSEFIDLIDIKSKRKSSLKVCENHLEVLGVLPHGSQLTLDTDSLFMLREWIEKQLKQKGN